MSGPGARTGGRRSGRAGLPKDLVRRSALDAGLSLAGGEAGIRARVMRSGDHVPVASRYDDDLWERVPDDPRSAPGHLRRFVRSLGPADHALDLGCGDGRLTLELEAERITAADPSFVALERARRRLGERPETQLLELAPDAPLPLPDSGHDLVLCAETIEHVRDVQLLLSEVRRVLRPGGRLALTTPAHGRLTGLDVLARGFEARFDPLSPHVRHLTRRSLRQLLTDMGFAIESLRRRRGSLMTVARR